MGFGVELGGTGTPRAFVSLEVHLEKEPSESQHCEVFSLSNAGHSDYQQKGEHNMEFLTFSQKLLF